MRDGTRKTREWLDLARRTPGFAVIEGGRHAHPQIINEATGQRVVLLSTGHARGSGPLNTRAKLRRMGLEVT